MSNGNLVNNLQNTVLNQEWLQGLYGKKSDEQKAELRKLFSQSAENADEDNSVDDAQLEALYTAKTNVLAKKVEQYEAKMAELQESIAEIEDQLAAAAAEIAEAVTKVESNSNDYSKDMDKRVKAAIEAEFKNYNNKPEVIGPQGLKTRITSAIGKAISGAQGTAAYAAIQENLEILNGAQNKYSNLIEKSANWINQANLLGKRYGATKSAYDLVNATLFQIGSAKGKYTNSDNDTVYPVYSPDKAEAAANLLNSNYVTTPSNTSYVEGSNDTRTTMADVSTKFAQYLKPEKSGGDANSYDNNAVKKLDEAIKAGMLDELAKTGVTSGEINKFLVDNFANANVRFNEEGKLTIPYGHGDKAKSVFSKLTKFVKDYATGDYVIENTWDPNKGNTIGSNQQIAQLQQFIKDGKLKELANLGFSFKEMANLLFNKDNGIFKDTGINYDLANQGNGANYIMDTAGDKETADLFKNIRTQIKDIWGVDALRGDGNVIQDDPPSDDVNSPGRTDPVGFMLNGVEYTFVIDRKDSTGVGNDTFDGAEEFVGGKQGTSWLDDLLSFDKDGDGILSGDELKELKLLSTKFTGEGNDRLKEREHDTKMEYDFVSAADLGITSIDLNAYKNGEANINQVADNQSNNWNFGDKQTDINGSLLYNDSFMVTFGTEGEEGYNQVTASRKDDTTDYMNAVYRNVYGKNFNGNGYLTEAQVDEIITRDYGEFNAFAEQYAGAESNLGIVQNADRLAAEAEAFARTNEDQAMGRKNALMQRALNRAENLEGDVGDWNNMEPQVIKEAQRRGIAITEDFREQCRGYFGRSSGVDAVDIVNQYVSNLEEMKMPQRVEDNNGIVSKTLLLAAQKGYDIPAEKIMQAYDSGKAKTPEELFALLSQGANKTGVMSFANINPDSIEDNPDGLDLSGRTNELYEAFNKVFAERYADENERAQEIVDAIRELCVMEQNNPGYMNNRPAEEIAREFLKK